MLDYSTITDNTAHRTNEAIRLNKQPCIIDRALVGVLRDGETSGKLIPFLGDYTPSGWVQDGEPLFVDSTRWGDTSEPALTWGQLAAILNQHLGEGVGVIEAGQFQVYLAIYKRINQ